MADTKKTDSQSLVDFTQPIGDIIKKLKLKAVEIPAWDDIAKEYDQEQHPIKTDPTLRPKDKEKDGQKEKAAKVTYPVEKISVQRVTQMGFTIPVKRIYTTTDETGKEDLIKVAQKKAIEVIYKQNRIDGENMNRFRAYFAACEIMTIWYTVEDPNKRYGFESKFKLKCRSYSPMPTKSSRITQASLYPLFDEHDDMVAMSFEYTRKVGEDTIAYFETYTRDTHYKWQKRDSDWEEAITPEPIPIGKHPLIYVWRPEPIWSGVSNNRDEIEFTLSRTSDIIRKNSKPIIKITGDIKGTAPVGDSAREVYQLENGGDLGLVAPPVTTDAAEFYIGQLKQNIEEDVQMPNLSMENIKGLGEISGEARKTLLTDGHLKIGDEKHEIVKALDRECNVIKAFLGEMNVAWKDSILDFEVEHVITPFVQNDEQAEIEKLGKGVDYGLISRRTAIQQLGWVDDVDAEMEQIKKEQGEVREAERVAETFPGAE